MIPRDSIKAREYCRIIGGGWMRGDILPHIIAKTTPKLLEKTLGPREQKYNYRD